ncbi:hypothetical protein MKW98_002218, partial [Papaver atlanticum]
THGYVNLSDRLVLSPEKHQNHGVQLTLRRFDQILDVKATIAYGQHFDMNTEGCIANIKSATIRVVTYKSDLGVCNKWDTNIVAGVGVETYMTGRTITIYGLELSGLRL